MGSEFFKHPAKRLDREFRSMGAVRVARTSAAVRYEFPDGASRLVNTNIGPGSARDMLNDMQRIYGAPARDPLGHTERRPGAPAVDLSQVVASGHAMERFELMRRQANLDYHEILVALRAPAKVLWSPDHDAWLWVGDRIAVAAVVQDRRVTILTLLWTTRELWAQNPRPQTIRR